MSEYSGSYHESLYQWVWENLEFELQGLQTTEGKSVEIINQGRLNKGAGPDFLRAHVRIEKTDWYGSIEIHKAARDWNRHNHQNDANYNNVVLHVVFENPEAAVYTQSGSVLHTVNLSSYLKKELRHLLFRKNSSSLSCSENIHFINQEAFKEQVRKAHKEYFEYKVGEVLNHYDPSLPVSKAWKNSFLIQLYNCMGIPRNRKQMEMLAKELIADPGDIKSADHFADYVMEIAFSRKFNFSWKTSGMRPASRPAKRVRQAAALHASIRDISLKSFLKDGVNTWGKIIGDTDPQVRPGKARLSILKHTVFLPSIYLLGDLYHVRNIQKDSFEEWENTHQNVPAEIIKPFQKAGFKIEKEIKVMGLAHQYKRYCRKKQCHNCNVFKNAIRS